MGDPSRSPTTDHHGIFGFPIKDMCKAYKYFTGKRHHEKNSPPKEAIDESFSKSVNGKEKEDKLTNDYEPSTTEPFNHCRSVDDSFFAKSSSSLRTASRRSHTPSPRPTYLAKSASKKSTSSPTKKSPTSLLRSFSRKSPSETEIPTPSSSVRGSNTTETTTDVTDQINATSLSRNMSRRSTTPIIFSHSQTTTRRKPPPIEKKLVCTLEELSQGGVKKIKITKDVIKDPGIIVQEQEILRIKLKPGWKKGTKITFEGKGDEKPGYLPADIIFSIEEKRHPLFKRRGHDLEIAAEIPLVKALIGCSLAVPLLGGETMNIAVRDIIYHGCEKVIKGQGMPIPTEEGKRGDLRITFLVIFPHELSDEQRSEACRILQDCF